MQASCPQCAQRIVVDDARAPDRPFAVRCPKCQATVRFPGKAAAGAIGGAAAAGTPPAPATAAPGAAAGSEAAATDDARSALIAHLRREVASREPGHGRQVLVALPDRSLAGGLTLPLTRLGYSVEVLDTPEEGGRMLEDGTFDVVITNRTAAVPGRSETLYQRVTRLAPDLRRRIFLLLVGEEYKTGDGMQAFAAQADLVVNPRDAGTVEAPLLNTMAERARLYQAFLDARRRQEAADA